MLNSIAVYLPTVMASPIRLDNLPRTIEAESPMQAWVKYAIRLIDHANNAMVVIVQVRKLGPLKLGTAAVGLAVLLNKLKQFFLSPVFRCLA